VAVNFTIMAMALWFQSGRPRDAASKGTSSIDSGVKQTPLAFIELENEKALIPAQVLGVEERHIFLPLTIVAIAQFLGVIPLYLFNHSTETMLSYTFGAFAVVNWALPYVASAIIIHYFEPTAQQYQLMKTFSLLFLGMFLSSLATLNFSLALLVGLLATPLTYVQPLPRRPFLAAIAGLLVNFLTPTAVLYLSSLYWNIPVGDILKEAAFGWDVWGMNTQVVVWCVWWPAWLVGAVLLLGKPRDE